MEELIKFLKKENCYKQFVTNVQSEFDINCITEVLLVIQMTQPIENWISSAFHWDKSPEGIIFWIKIYTKWMNYIAIRKYICKN